MRRTNPNGLLFSKTHSVVRVGLPFAEVEISRVLSAWPARYRVDNTPVTPVIREHAFVVRSGVAVARAPSRQGWSDDLGVDVNRTTEDQAARIVGIAIGRFIVERRAEQVHSVLQFVFEFGGSGMAGQTDHHTEGVQVFLIQAIQLADEDVEGMRNGDPDILPVHSSGSLRPKGTRSKAQRKARFHVEAGLFLGRHGEPIPTSTSALRLRAIQGELQRRRAVEREVETPFRRERFEEALEERARWSFRTDLTAPLIRGAGRAHVCACQSQDNKGPVG